MCPPYTSHQPPAVFCTAPTPVHPLRAWLHCHIWTCLSIHGSHCLEEFSPQTSPSGISYPMVGVPSMCPPPPINLQQYSTLHLHPHTCSEPGCTATLGCACPSMFPIAWRNFHHKPVLVQPGTVPIPDLCITKSNPCGPHVAHLPSLWACTTHIAIQGSGLAGSPVTKVAPIFHCGKPCNWLANYSIPWPMGREILLSGQDSDLSSLGAYKGSALRGG